MRISNAITVLTLILGVAACGDKSTGACNSCPGTASGEIDTSMCTALGSQNGCASAQLVSATNDNCDVGHTATTHDSCDLKDCSSFSCILKL